MSHVELLEKAASDLTGIEEKFDVVVINSVVQYFPDSGYLVRVLKGAADRLVTGGKIFIGDVRSLPLLRALRASVELHNAPDALPVEVLRQRVQRQVAQESELLFDPMFFRALGKDLPGIERVSMELKQGHFRNELTQFRYDVLLEFGSIACERNDGPTLHWQKDALSLSSLRKLLRETKPKFLEICGVPNAQIAAEVQLLALMDQETLKTTGEFRRAIRSLGIQGIDPDDIRKVGERLSYTVSIGWNGSGSDGNFDVQLRSGKQTGAIGFTTFHSGTSSALENPHQFANNPLEGSVARRAVPHLREFLDERLPDYMIPSAFLFVDSLPRTPNGKIDRVALPSPDGMPASSTRPFVAPRTPIEKVLGDIWTEVLNLERIGVHDNFFELGGHSLLATQLVSRIRVTLSSELPVRAIFEAPTIAGLAGKIGTASAEPSIPQGATITRVPRASVRGASVTGSKTWRPYFPSQEPARTLRQLPLDLPVSVHVPPRLLDFFVFLMRGPERPSIAHGPPICPTKSRFTEPACQEEKIALAKKASPSSCL